MVKCDRNRHRGRGRVAVLLSVGDEFHVDRLVFQEFDPLFLRTVNAAHRLRPAGGHFRLVAQSLEPLERLDGILHPESHVIEDRAFCARVRVRLVQQYQDTRELEDFPCAHHHRLAAEGHPEFPVRFHVLHVVVQVAHRHTRAVRRPHLRPRDADRTEEGQNHNRDHASHQLPPPHIE